MPTRSSATRSACHSTMLAEVVWLEAADQFQSDKVPGIGLGKDGCSRNSERSQSELG